MRLFYAAIIFEIFIQLTQPGGGRIWIQENHIVLIRPALGGCTGKTTVTVDSGTMFCVVESMDEIRRVMQQRLDEPEQK